MTTKGISLSDLTGGENYIQKTEDQETTAPVASETSLEAVNISDIAGESKKIKYTQDVQKLNMDGASDRIDAAIERTKLETTERIIKPFEEELIKQELEAKAKQMGSDDGQMDISPIEPVMPDMGDAMETNYGTVSINFESGGLGLKLEGAEELDLEDNSGIEESEQQTDLDEEQVNKAIREEFVKSVHEKIVPMTKKDPSQFKISKTPISVSKILSKVKPEAKTANWIMPMLGRSFEIQEFRGDSLLKLNPRDDTKNLLNLNHTIFYTLYQHIVDANKPTFEQWLRTIYQPDIPHIHFGVYMACFKDSNFIPYICDNNNCRNIWLDKKDISDMVEYETPEAKAKVQAILNGETTSPDQYEATLEQISDNYFAALRLPSVYRLAFENATLSPKFIEKNQQFIGIASYIDGIYFIDEANGELVPVDMKPNPNSVAESTKRRLTILHELLNPITSDQQTNLLVQISKVGSNLSNLGRQIKYVLPEATCPKCGKVHPKEDRNPIDMLFTRHQLVATETM